MFDEVNGSHLLRVSLFGEFRVERRLPAQRWETVANEEWGGHSYSRSLLKWLVCSAGRRALRGTVVEALWPEMRSAEMVLTNAVSNLRQVLGGHEVLRSFGSHQSTGYELAGQSVVWVDGDACDALLVEAESVGLASVRAVALLEEALRLFGRGGFLEGDGGIWCHMLRVHQEKAKRRCLLWLSDGYEVHGKVWQARGLFCRLLDADPFDEDVSCRFLTFLHRNGMTKDALDYWKEAQVWFKGQGLSISATIQQLVKKIASEGLSVEVYLTAREVIPLSVERVGKYLVPCSPSEELVSHQMVVSFPTASLLDGMLVKGQETLYDMLEVGILSAALQWRFQLALLPMFQQSVREKMKEYDNMVQHSRSDSTNISRRHALRAIVKFPIQLYGVAALGAYNLPSEEGLSLYAAGLTACKSLYDQGEVAVVANTLVGYLAPLEALTHGSQTSTAKQAAATLTAQGYLLATLIADHLRRLDYMEAYSREACRYAKIAVDPNLEVSALARLAVKYDYESRDAKALQTYQQALELPSFGLVSPLLQGRIYAGLAGTSAYCYQRKDSLNFLALAKDVYPANPEDDPCFHFAYSGKDTIFLWEGLTRKYLRQYTQAWDAFTQVGQLQPQQGIHERNRAEFLNYAASIAIKQRNLDACRTYIEAAEEIAWNTNHEQRYAEVMDTFRSMQILWPDEQVVKILQDKFVSRSLLP